MTCEKCNGTGYYTHRTTFPCSYVGPGRCPDDVRGMTDAKCDECRAGLTEDEGDEPCPVCGNEERGQGGYLSCECPALKAQA